MGKILYELFECERADVMTVGVLLICLNLFATVLCDGLLVDLT